VGRPCTSLHVRYAGCLSRQEAHLRIPGGNMSNDLAYLTATELVASYAKKELSPVEATQAALDRIDGANEAVNAFCVVDADRALASAQESEQRWQRGEPAGPVDGVPTSIKDVFLTRGWPTLRGSRTVDPDQEWSVDAPCVARL